MRACAGGPSPALTSVPIVLRLVGAVCVRVRVCECECVCACVRACVRVCVCK